MKTRICYQQSVTSGQPLPLTPEIWDSLIDSPEVSNLCRRIAALDPTAPDYNDRKQALKKRLPIIIPHAASFKNGKRISADAIPSGLAMLDVDHINQPKDWFDRFAESVKTANAERPSYGLKDFLAENGIYLIAITASGHGLRVIGERRFRTGASQPCGMESIEAAQLRIAQSLDIVDVVLRVDPEGEAVFQPGLLKLPGHDPEGGRHMLLQHGLCKALQLV